jgi:AbrB family looped-hinge helix DNA binding protein
MSMLGTTKMSSKGQIVIPEEIRRQLGLRAGTQFVVIGEGDVVILRSISPPSMEDFDRQIKKARKAARLAGLRPKDVSDAVGTVRKRSR